MLRNYLKIALRNLWKNQPYSFINIIGLSLGLVCFLLIALYVFDELTFDSFHKNANAIYRVVEKRVSPEGKESRVASVAYKIAEQSPLNLPEIKKAARLSVMGRANISDPTNVNSFYDYFLIANKDFLSVFDFILLEGNRSTALTAPRSALLTEEMAKKIFGKTNVVGKMLSVDRDSLPFTITGILKNFPANSHLSFNIVFSESSLTGQGYRDFIAGDWNSNFFPTYLLLETNVNPIQVADKLNKLINSHRNREDAIKSSIWLQPLKGIHFYSEGIDTSINERRGNINYIYVFALLALFVLLIACINYMNLATARFASRSKEIAVRKVAGAGRHQLVSQFFSEALFVIVLSLIIGLIIVQLVLPAFNQFTEKNLGLGLQTDYRIWIGVLLTIVFVGFAAGLYPALFQSRLNPFHLLKNKLQGGNRQLSIRKGLVIFQFALSIIMIVATIVVVLQMRFLDTTNMGFNKEQLLVVDINSGKVRREAETIMNEYSRIASVKSVTVSSRVPGEWKIVPKVKVRSGGTSSVGNEVYFIATDDEFLDTYQIDLLRGRNFSAANSGDSSAVIINETAAKLFGITEPSEQPVEIPSVDFSGSVSNLEQPFKARVIGITRDFNFRSLREKVAPLILGYRNNPIHSIDYFTVRLSAQQSARTLEQLETILHRIDASHLFEYNFLDKQWDLFYREDQKRQTIFLSVSLISILVACLGLFGLSTYAAEKRIREIGIRKVLGASVSGIIILLSKDFLKLVLISALVAIPLGWYTMNRWLDDFAYRIQLQWWIPAIAAIVAFLIAFVTVCFQAIKAAVANPVKSLRTE